MVNVVNRKKFIFFKKKKKPKISKIFTTFIHDYFVNIQ